MLYCLLQTFFNIATTSCSFIPTRKTHLSQLGARLVEFGFVDRQCVKTTRDVKGIGIGRS